MAVGEQKTDRGSWAAQGRRLRRYFGAWQPLTGGGVALFRTASLTRVLGFQFAVALLSAGAVVWTLGRAWFPVITRALAELPDTAEVVDGRLRWPDGGPVRLAESAWLDLVVAPTNRSELGQTADLQVAFEAAGLRLTGFAGQRTLPYRPEWSVPLGRIEATARWGAWRRVLAAGLGLGVTAGLVLTWWCLATLYALPARLGAWVAGRQTGVTGAWRLAAAALLPGALCLDWGLVAYGLGAIRLPGLIAVFALHWLVGWGWLAWGVARCPRVGAKSPSNPFETEEPQ